MAFALAACLAIQWWQFSRHVRRYIAPVYPMHYDQLVSLSVAYEAYERTRDAGMAAALGSILASDHPMGLLLPLAGWVTFVIGGPSRLGALAVNFAAYALMQVTVVLVVRRLAGWPAALLGWGLTWALQTAYEPAGGIVDFRSDFAALCLYAVWLGLTLAGRAFESPRLSLLAGCAAAACVWARFLAIVYIGAVLALFVAVMLVRGRRATSETARRSAWARCRGAASCGLVVLAASAPGLWAQREPIAAHYFRGILGPLRIVRAQVVGADRPLANLAYYPQSLVAHAGPVVTTLAAILAVLLVVDLARRRGAWRSDTLASAWLVALALVVPIVVLTLLTSKQPVVGGIALAPVLFAIPLAADRFFRRLTSSAPSVGPAVAWAAAATIALAGAAVQFKGWRRPIIDPVDAAGVFALYDAVAAQSRQLGPSAPLLSVDHVSDGLNGLAVSVGAYERQRARLRVRSGLGSSIGAVDEADALARARESDFVILTVSDAPNVFPADRSLAAVRPALRELCRGSMRPLGRFRAPGREVELFGRPGT